jgi:E3 ubiquitin-protein ligase SIAH1
MAGSQPLTISSMAGLIRSYFSPSLNGINIYFCSVGVTAGAMVKMPQLSLESVNDSIVSLFECPVCYEYLAPPIYQCKNAHNICSDCKKQVTRCPTCNEIFLDSRSVFVEQIAERLLYPCKNIEFGCRSKQSLQDIVKHQNECPYRIYECLPGKVDSCKWKGRSFDILAHMTETHENSCWMVDENFIIYELNIFGGTEDIQLISACHEVFWYNFKCDPTEQKLFLAVQYIGPKELASSFAYEFELCADADQEMCIKMKNRTHPDTEKASDIFESACCVVIDFSTLRHYVTIDNNLSFNLLVKRIVTKDSACDTKEGRDVK